MEIKCVFNGCLQICRTQNSLNVVQSAATIDRSEGFDSSVDPGLISQHFPTHSCLFCHETCCYCKRALACVFAVDYLQVSPFLRCREVKVNTTWVFPSPAAAERRRLTRFSLFFVGDAAQSRLSERLQRFSSARSSSTVFLSQPDARDRSEPEKEKAEEDKRHLATLSSQLLSHSSGFRCQTILVFIFSSFFCLKKERIDSGCE